jgi:hypothetical protein
MATKRQLNLAGLAEVAEVLHVTRRHAIRLCESLALQAVTPQPSTAPGLERRGDVEQCWAR